MKLSVRNSRRTDSLLVDPLRESGPESLGENCLVRLGVVRRKNYGRIVQAMMAKSFILVISVVSALIVLRIPLPVISAVPATVRKFDSRRVRRSSAETINDYIDFSVRPCDDFYQHACGKWERLNPIPDDVVDYKPIKALSYQTDLKVRDLLFESFEDRGSNSAEVKAKVAYASCVNQTSRDSLGVEPLLNFIETLGGWPVMSANWSDAGFDWLHTLAVLRRYGDRILIKESVSYNKRNSSYSIIYLDQPSLGLVNRADYLDSFYSFRLNAYRTYMLQVLKILGVDDDNAEQMANETISFETSVARILAHPYERVNVSTFATEISLTNLQAKVPGIDWIKYLSLIFERPIESSQMVVIKEFKYMNKLADLIARTDSRILANYIYWRFAQTKLSRLNSVFDEPLQRCFSILLGRKTRPPRWKMCVNDISYHMREAIGAMFVRSHFDENDRQEVAEILEKLKKVLKKIIYNTTWLDQEAKGLIEKKIDLMKYQIGYPDSIHSEDKVNKIYENLTIVPDRYFDNFMSLLRHTVQRKHAKLFVSDNEDNWSGVSPDLTSAYYNPTKNKITIPAGLLQEPLFSRHYSKAFNYGRMGALIGHEMTHAFDNIGRNYDFSGNMNSWWNQSLIDTFSEKIGCISRQYSQYRVPDSKHLLDSQGTLSENIADNGGLVAAYKAFKETDNKDDILDKSDDSTEMSDDAIFFYSFAQLWCGRIRPEAVLTQARRDPHSPAIWRVIGTLSNSEDFSRVFNCSPGSFMNPMKKCKIW